MFGGCNRLTAGPGRRLACTKFAIAVQSLIAGSQEGSANGAKMGNVYKEKRNGGEMIENVC